MTQVSITTTSVLDLPTHDEAWKQSRTTIDSLRNPPATVMALLATWPLDVARKVDFDTNARWQAIVDELLKPSLAKAA